MRKQQPSQTWKGNPSDPAVLEKPLPGLLLASFRKISAQLSVSKLVRDANITVASCQQ